MDKAGPMFRLAFELKSFLVISMELALMTPDVGVGVKVVVAVTFNRLFGVVFASSWHQYCKTFLP